MRNDTLGQRYGQALFDAALRQGAADQVGNDLEVLLSMRTEDRPLARVLEAPNIRDDEKHALFDKVLKDQAHPITLRLLHLLLEKRRTFLFEATAEAYLEFLRAHRGEVKARVWTAIPLDDSRRNSLRESIEKRTSKTVEIDATVDPDILGGVIVVWGDQILDGSVRTKIHEMRDRLMEAKL